MHISTGKFEGKEIKDNFGGGPSSTRLLAMKEAIFEIIGVRIHEASVLDINDQNGMYGIEAMSKGAAAVQFINKNKEDSKLVRENVVSVGLDPDLCVLDLDLESLVDQKTDVRFDIIFFRANSSKCFSMIEKVLALQGEKGITIIQYPDTREYELREIPSGFQVIDKRSIEANKCLVLVRGQVKKLS